MASANGPTTDAQQEAFIRENLSRNGVSTQTQDALIAKLERGEAWDSLKGATPVSSEVRHANATRVQTDRYADGSVAVATIEAPSVSDVKPGSDGKARPASVTGCRLIRGTHYSAVWRDCYANVDLILVQMGFHFSRETYNGGQGKITGYDRPATRCILCTFSDKKLSRVNASVVRFSADGSVLVKGSPIQVTAWMEAHQGISNDAWTTHN